MNNTTTSNPPSKMPSNGDSQRTPPTLLGLPSELKTEVFRHLPISTLAVLQTVHSKIAPPARAILYEAPYFASTFRLAQFTQTITQNSLYGPLVHKIDLSELPEIGKYARAEELLQDLQNKRVRERARKVAAEAQRRLKEEEAEQDSRNTLCNANMTTLSITTSQTTAPAVSSHVDKIYRCSSDSTYTDLSAPPSSSEPLQKSYLSPAPKLPNETHFYYNLLQQAIKIPIGFLFHILTECTKIHVLNLNHVVFDTDYQTQAYLRDCNFSQHAWDYLLTFHPTTRAVREDREEPENKAILEQDLVALIVQLKGLTSLAVNGCNWMSEEEMAKLVEVGVVFGKDPEFFLLHRIPGW